MARNPFKIAFPRVTLSDGKEALLFMSFQHKTDPNFFFCRVLDEDGHFRDGVPLHVSTIKAASVCELVEVPQGQIIAPSAIDQLLVKP